jgi:hypothetical protein
VDSEVALEEDLVDLVAEVQVVVEQEEVGKILSC